MTNNSSTKRKYVLSGPADHLVGDGSKRSGSDGSGGRIGGPTTVMASSLEEAKYLAMVKRWGPPGLDNIGSSTHNYRTAAGLHEVE